MGGYSSDQVFLRYLKYKNHDLKHVFYLFMPTDQIFTTNLDISSEYKISIKQPKINIFFQILGKLNITYLAIDSYYFLKSKFKQSYTRTNIVNYDSILANKIIEKFYSNNKNKCDYNFFTTHIETEGFKNNQCVIDFIRLLTIFKNEVEARNGIFHILIYPEINNVNFFNKIINFTNEKFNFYVLDKKLLMYSKYKNKSINFENDAHWNEYGNLLFAKNLLEIFEMIGITFQDIYIKQSLKKIDNFYSQYK